MDQKERQILVTIISTVLITGFYVWYVYQKHVVGNLEILNDFKFWGRSFLWLIPLSVVTQIVIHILYAIINRIVTNEDVPSKTDEMDKLIELKAIRISHLIFTFGFIGAIGLLAFGVKPYVMFIILFSSGFLASIVSEIVKLFYYRRGI